MSWRGTSLLGVVGFVASACSAPSASTLTHPPRLESFPLYVAVAGNAPGEGVIYEVPAPAELDAPSDPVAILSGLDFPAAIAVARDGTVYYTDRPGLTEGRIMQYAGEGVEPIEIARGLADPQGLALDRSGKMYVVETAAGRVSRVSLSSGTIEAIADELVGPRSLTTDENDNLYVTETGRGTVVKLLPDGTRTQLASELRGPLVAGPGLVGSTFVLVGNGGGADGAVAKVGDGGSSEIYLDKLINPVALAWEDSTVLFVAEGAPARRIISYSRVTNLRVETCRFASDPTAIAFKPLN